MELLREALRADDRDTQIAASGALQRVEERLVARIAHAQEQLRLDPESAERLMAVGDACVAYQESRLLEAAMGRHWLGEAEAAYRAARARRPDWPAPAAALARVRLALGQVAEAETLAVEARAAAPSTEADLLLSEILFVQGRWGELRAALARRGGRRPRATTRSAGGRGSPRRDDADAARRRLPDPRGHVSLRDRRGVGVDPPARQRAPRAALRDLPHLGDERGGRTSRATRCRPTW